MSSKRYFPYSDARQRLDRDPQREIGRYLSPGQAGRIVGVTGTWMTRMAREKRIFAINTALGWLFEPGCVKRYAKDRSDSRRSEDSP